MHFCAIVFADGTVPRTQLRSSARAARYRENLADRCRRRLYFFLGLIRQALLIVAVRSGWSVPRGRWVGRLGFLIVQHDRLSLVLMFGHRTRSVPWATVSQRPDSRTVSPHLLTLNKLGRSIS